MQSSAQNHYSQEHGHAQLAPEPAPVTDTRFSGLSVAGGHGPVPTTARPEHGRLRPRAGAADGDEQPAPLVHRGQSFPTGQRPLSNGPRRSRFTRRSQSSRWLIADAVDSSTIEEIGDGVFVDTTSGELLSSDWVRPPRPARCGWRIGKNVAVHSNGQIAHFSGTERCGSIWACPVCSAVIRAERAREIGLAVEAHQAAGGSILFVTLTIRHDCPDSLKQSMDAVLGSWRKLLQGSAWVGSKNRSGMRDRFSVSGYIRSTDVTYGSSGWHPHLHSLFMTDRKLSESEVAAFGDELHTRWARFVKKATGKLPTREHGIDVQRVDEGGQVLGKYLAKIQDEDRSKTQKWDASAELARGDVKRGERDNILPFELLDSDQPLPLPQRRRLWAEYYEGTKGRRAITWSRGLKARHGIEERTDEEVIEETEAAPVQWLADGQKYDRVRRDDPMLLAIALEGAEDGNWQLIESILGGVLAPSGG